MMDLMAMSADVAAIAPVFLLGGLAMLVLVLGLAGKKEQGGLFAALCVVGLVVIGVLTALSWGSSRSAFGRMMVVDNFYVFFGVISIAATALAVVLSTAYTERMGLAYPE